MNLQEVHPPEKQDLLTKLVSVFLNSNLSLILIILAMLIGIAALSVTPREEDPQIVVPLADIYVEFPGHRAAEVEQLVAAPLEKRLYQIDGVEYVYSMSRDDSAIITVRFYVGQDRERSLVKLFKKLNESNDAIPPGVTGWVMKPVEIDDVPIVAFALTGADDDTYALRRVGEELVERFAVVPQVSRVNVIGGEPRTFSVEFNPDRLLAYQMDIESAQRSVQAANVALANSNLLQRDQTTQATVQSPITSAEDLRNLVIGVFDERPVFLKDVAEIRDGADEITQYVRHGWGLAQDFELHRDTPGWIVGGEVEESASNAPGSQLSHPAVTLAISKQKGANAVRVAADLMQAAQQLRNDVLPDNMQLIVTRNSGIVANDKVNELVEALGVAIIIVILLLTFGLGWREAIIVSIAVPVVFGLTLAVNLMFGYTINRVTLFALILALGLLVDDPIVDVENIARHFETHHRASRRIVLDAVAEIRPPLISATLAVIVSFLPMFFITGMMGPYMSPMALNVPIAMAMSMLVAFTITPWLSYHVLTWKTKLAISADEAPSTPASTNHMAYDPAVVQRTGLYRFFRPLMLPLLASRARAAVFLLFMLGLTFAAMSLGALRMVPLKMLPYDNKNEILLLVDLPEGSSLERTDATIQAIEQVIRRQPEVVNYVSSVGASGPIDFNGMVRHYYLRSQSHQAEIRVNFVGKKSRREQSHALGLRVRDELNSLAQSLGAKLQIVELPPGPPVLAAVVAEIYGQDNSDYQELLAAANTVVERMQREPGLAEVDDISEAETTRWVFKPDQEKAALAGVTVAAISTAVHTALTGDRQTVVRVDGERNPLRITLRIPRSLRSSVDVLSTLPIQGRNGALVPLSELGSWQQEIVSQTIYHKNLRRVVYVFAETVGRTPAECVIDLLSDQETLGKNYVGSETARPVSSRTFLSNGSGIPWSVSTGLSVDFAGEGEWKITLDVFRDLGLAFAAAMLMIYIILVAQTGSFLVPLVVMLAIPLTALGVMPGFYVLGSLLSSPVGEYSNPVYFTATAMIGMIALSGIVTRDSIILVDFIQQSVRQGRPLVDAILESRVVRLRPILLTAGAALLSALPITLDPIFSGLGWSLIFGLIASTLFTLFVIPITYWIIYAARPNLAIDQ